MIGPTIKYRTGYKYQLAAEYSYQTGIIGHEGVGLWFSLEEDGMLYIRDGYSFDGPSGPALDTKTFMRASLIHDCLYQMMRQGQLPLSARDSVDNIMRQVCLEDGMPAWRAWYSYHAVRLFAASAADPSNAKPILTAP